MEEQADSHSLKNKLKSSLCLSCCFRSCETSDSSGTPDSSETPRLVRASSTWLKSRANELPDIKDKCWNLISRIGRGRRHSADYRYDALSYSLNFDDGSDESHGDEHPLRNFSSRLPLPPPQAGVTERAAAAAEVVRSREIAACS